MSLYSIALFAHIVGALLLFVTLTVEGVALLQLRRATTTEAAAGAAGLLRLNRIVGPLSALGVLIPGLYMSATSWGWVAWIAVALASWVVIAVLGAVNGIRILALERSHALLTGIQNPMFRISWSTRVGIALGVVFLMAVKPGTVAAVLAIVIAAIAGATLGTAVWTARRTREGQVA
ncbi:MAG TPA: hypothetical protein VF383_00650 [Candidatus Dormibacteraeota bacterium]